MNPSKLESEIEKALVEDPTHTEAFSVYADYLQQQGDPRGELIACQLRSTKEAKRRAAQLLKEHARDLLGIFADQEEESPLSLEWRCGFIRWARLYVDRKMEDDGFDQATLTKALLSLPSSRLP